MREGALEIFRDSSSKQADIFRWRLKFEADGAAMEISSDRSYTGESAADISCARWARKLGVYISEVKVFGKDGKVIKNVKF